MSRLVDELYDTINQNHHEQFEMLRILELNTSDTLCKAEKLLEKMLEFITNQKRFWHPVIKVVPSSKQYVISSWKCGSCFAESDSPTKFCPWCGAEQTIEEFEK